MHNSLGEYNQVQELYEKALLLFRELFCKYHTDLATGYSMMMICTNNLALAYKSLGEHNQAKGAFRKCTDDLQKTFSVKIMPM